MANTNPLTLSGESENMLKMVGKDWGAGPGGAQDATLYSVLCVFVIIISFKGRLVHYYPSMPATAMSIMFLSCLSVHLSTHPSFHPILMNV